MEVKCVLKCCVDSKSGTSERTGNQWQTDEWLAVIPGPREKKIKFEVRGIDRCREWQEFFNNMPEKNAPVLIRFEIDARCITKDGKESWFNSVEAWNIEITTW